jgi:hypothetical protein
MPEIVRCPGCSRTLQVPDDLLGKAVVRCPSCQVTFTAQAVASEPPPPPMPKMEIEQHDEPLSWYDAAMEEIKADDGQRVAISRKPKRRANEDESTSTEEDYGDDDETEEVAERRGRRSPPGSRSEWQRTRSGLGYLLAAAVTVICSIFAVICAEMGAGLKMVVGIVGILAAIVLHLVGLIVCLSAPEYRGARTLAKITLGLYGASLVAQIVYLLHGVIFGPEGALSILGMLVGFGHLGTLIFMLRALAFGLREQGLAKNAFWFFIYYVVCVVITALGYMVTMVTMMIVFQAIAAGGGAYQSVESMGRVLAICGPILLLLGLGLIIWYIITLTKTRSAISRAARR